MTLEERVDRAEQEWRKKDPFVVGVRRCLAILVEAEPRSGHRLRDQERQYAPLRSRIKEHDRWIEESRALGPRDKPARCRSGLGYAGSLS